MTEAQWDTLKKAVRGEVLDAMPTAFIMDSPWLPPWAGRSLMDYYGDDRTWLDANFRAVEAFPDIIFLPGFWAEFGMCTEPSAFGAKCRWETHNLPHAQRIIADLESPFSLERPDPRKDGLLPFVLSRLSRCREEMRARGHDHRFAVARGPLNIASFLCGTTEFLMGLHTAEERVAELLDTITDFIIDWIELQLTSFDTMDGILILDDLVGFLGPDDFLRVAAPRLKRIYGSFGRSVNFLHNDANGLVCAPHLTGLGVNLFNFSHEHGLAEMRSLAGPELCLLGNIPPRDVLAAGSEEEIGKTVRAARESLPSRERVILSCGGGLPPGVSTAQLRAFIDAAAS